MSRRNAANRMSIRSFGPRNPNLGCRQAATTTRLPTLVRHVTGQNPTKGSLDYLDSCACPQPSNDMVASVFLHNIASPPVVPD
eukprot:9485152-Pyramimonas_sp.AAC.1